MPLWTTTLRLSTAPSFSSSPRRVESWRRQARCGRCAASCRWLTLFTRPTPPASATCCRRGCPPKRSRQRGGGTPGERQTQSGTPPPGRPHSAAAGGAAAAAAAAVAEGPPRLRGQLAGSRHGSGQRSSQRSRPASGRGSIQRLSWWWRLRRRPRRRGGAREGQEEAEAVARRSGCGSCWRSTACGAQRWGYFSLPG